MERRFALAIALAVVVTLAAVPAPVAAEETRSGGTVVVDADETVDEDLTAFAGTVVVRGTVDGDLTAFAGNVFVDGTVTGDLEAFAGNVRINGTVEGDASAAGGNVFLAQSGRVGGQLDAGAGNVVLEGEVGSDARLGGGTVTVRPSAAIGGDLEYSGQLDLADGATVDGQVRQTDDLDVGITGPSFPGWLGWAYGLLVNLLLGAVLLLVFPRFSGAVAGRAIERPLRSAGVGLALFVGVPVLLVVFAITLVGIPLSLFGAVVYGLAIWTGLVYGSFSIGTWLLAIADVDNRWLALAVGVLVVSIADFVPVVSGLVQFVVVLLGLGALALAIWDRYQNRNRPAGRGSAVGTGAS
ncbi:bactofilin family protein [Halorussus marinus]|uniref:bactofilin family protein n=1 Tax=Halorussus marinus TaxID=2505976 RepID=UPI00106EEBB7|nr:polymer-forming cytoskeletal protein [Halorussus marinus]